MSRLPKCGWDTPSPAPGPWLERGHAFPSGRDHGGCMCQSVPGSLVDDPSTSYCLRSELSPTDSVHGGQGLITVSATSRPVRQSILQLSAAPGLKAGPARLLRRASSGFQAWHSPPPYPLIRAPAPCRSGPRHLLSSGTVIRRSPLGRFIHFSPVIGCDMSVTQNWSGQFLGNRKCVCM